MRTFRSLHTAWIISYLSLSFCTIGYANIQSGLKLKHEGHYHQAFQTFMYESKQGNPIGAFNLAVMFEDGLGVKRNTQKALYYYRLAAKAGIANAMTNIGYMYQEGKGVPINKPAAIDWYIKAIHFGDQKLAAHNLANLYYQEQPPHYVKAYHFYKIAAKAGSATSAFMLGMMRLKGEGIQTNEMKAYEYFYKARLGGFTLKPTDIVKFEAQLTPKQIQIFKHGVLTTKQVQTPR